ncbi:DUF1573 domain-containing protein [Sediminibacterium ginsengisoli]|uniref:DUF1573 domain-containing protein n=1 Tax=Sediminibacterium ginsengisoli TaxID=413434 RepID=A0A1T4PHH4_9BACT|nr:DUF1573 domain-containing protein [Sediminibacterium ginsengisoli]SJZ90993.1 Protein of unknown function [Sediminibacterium ginsengisoli]
MKPVKRLICLFAGTVLIATACQNNQDKKIAVNKLPVTDTANFTQAEWLDSLVNFGSITMGEKINIVFRVKNTGTKPLLLSNVTPSCGCTVADYSKEAIAPGAVGMVQAAFDSNRSHPGDVRKTITVTTNTFNGAAGRTLIFTGFIKEKP